MRTRVLPTVAVAILALALTGCTGSADDDSAGGAVQSGEPHETTTQPQNDDETTGKTEGLTMPGTELPIGGSATVVFPDSRDGDQRIKITVTDVAEAPKSDFDDRGKGARDRIDGHTPYYVTATTTKLEPFELDLEGYQPLEELHVYGSDGTQYQHLSFIVPGVCEFDFMDDANDAGEPIETCLIFAVPEGEKLGSVGWAPWWTGYDPDTGGEPITWTP